MYNFWAKHQSSCPRTKQVFHRDVFAPIKYINEGIQFFEGSVWKVFWKHLNLLYKYCSTAGYESLRSTSREYQVLFNAKEGFSFNLKFNCPYFQIPLPHPQFHESQGCILYLCIDGNIWFTLQTSLPTSAWRCRAERAFP